MKAGDTIDAAFSGQLGGFTLEAGFTAPGRGITALFGPSGCGKTSVLRCIAGLQRLSGRCRVGAETWQDERSFLPPHRRPVGYVFQEASLFPHLSVRGNLIFARRGRMASDATAPVRFEEVIDLLRLEPLLERAPERLSGGERQRVAIGRALLSRPEILLMDEPLSALDLETRDEILPFLETLHANLSIPVVYVTHDSGEVERLADHLVLMDRGRVIASGPLEALQSDVTLPLALRRDAAVSLGAKVAGHDRTYGLLSLEVAGGTLQIAAAAQAEGGEVRLRVRASDVSVATERPGSTSILNILPARIQAAEAVASHEMVLVLRLGSDGAGARLLARITRRSWDGLGLHPGREIYAQIKGAAIANG